jgi:hypothetical protein
MSRSLLPLLLVLLAACEVTLDDEPEEVEGDPRFGSSSERCVVPSSASVKFSLTYPEGVYLISADAGLGIALLGDDDPCSELVAGGSTERPPVRLLDFTAEEREQGLVTEDGFRLELVPVSGFVVGGQGYLFYEKTLQRDIFEVVRIGVGVARLPFAGPAERLAPKRFISEPTLLWLDSRGGRAGSALLGSDGLVYVYDTFIQSEWNHQTFVARVTPDQVADPAAYRYFGEDEWVDTPERARPLLFGFTSLSIVHNAYLDRYVFLFPGVLSDTVNGRIADSPWGPFGKIQPLYEGTPPTDFWIRDVAGHEAFASADGRTLLTSYYTTPIDEPAGLRLVDVTLR